MDCNGYVLIYKPKHHMAFSNGCVYEHILKAEEKLNRDLKPGEVVHHIDRDRKNNDVENLMIFDSDRSHGLFHSGARILKNGDVWTCKERSNEECPICGKRKFISAKLCRDCYKKENRKSSNIPSRETLLDLLIHKKENFASIGRIFGVSDNAVRKWCVSYGIPRTSREIKKLRV